MDVIIISLTALLASGLTFFSGFGLGTLLMPVIALFFSVEIAISVTAMVHLANNIFKGLLVGPKANKPVLLNFGIPAVLFAFVGASLLFLISGFSTLGRFEIVGFQIEIVPLKFVIGVLILIFAILELTPSFNNLTIDKKYLAYGGALSGFFGGLSGHQGAFRSMFLIKSGLDKESFIATGIMIAVMVDISRLSVYGFGFSGENTDWYLVIAATLSAFSGAFIGSRLLTKVTIHSLQAIISVFLILISLGMMTGYL
jgi:uncharacterized membrane protein YfcA